MRRKIAPEAERLVRASLGSLRIDDADKNAGERQFRALLAVARAARPALGLMTNEKWDALQRALARLDKASATPRGDR